MKSIAKIKEIKKMIEICEFCGKTYKKNLTPDAYLGDNCFDCSFWLKKTCLKPADEARKAIIDGKHYMIGGEGYLFRGNGGREFHILFNDGRDVRTMNLWEQGKIPEEFRSLLPDNAQFIPVEKPEPITFDDFEIPF